MNGDWIGNAQQWDLGDGQPQGHRPIWPARASAQVVSCACCAGLDIRVRSSAADRATAWLECGRCAYTWREVGLVFDRVLVARPRP